MDIDEVYVRTGEFGRFQQKAFIGICLTTIFCGTQMVQNIFDGAIPANLTCLSNPKLHACHSNCSKIKVNDDEFSSFAIEWNMLCGSSTSQAESTQSIFMSGLMIGSFFMGGLGDRYGRFPILVGCELICSIFAFASSFAQNWITYVILRFLTGFFESGIIIVGFVLTSELVGPSKRNLVGTIPALTFALGICLLSVTAWLTLNWRVLSALLGVFGLLTVPPVYWLYYESPRWYLGKGNIEKCKDVLATIAKVNGVSLGSFNLKVSESASNGEKPKSASIIDLFKNKILLKLTLIQLYTWFTVSAVYYGLTLAAGKMGDNKYISVIFNAFVEIPSNLVVIFLMNHPRLGRVKCCVIGLIMSSLCCASIWFVPDDFTTVLVGLSCSGKFFACISFAVVYVQAAELYPTPVRNVGLGMLSVFNRIGGVLAPQFVSLDHIKHNSHFVLFGLLGLIASIVSAFLPETLGRPLPDTPEDIYTDVKKLDKNVVKFTETDRRKLLSDMDDDDEDDTRI